MTASVQSVIRLTPSIRKKASANIWQRKDDAFDMVVLHECIQEALDIPDSPETETNVFEKLRQIDLSRIIKESPGIDRYFTCSFFIKRYAWISQNNKGEYRYFSKIKDGYGYYALDLFDLLGILMNQSTKKSIEYLQQTFGVESMTIWDGMEKEKYEVNADILASLTSETTPALKRILQGGTDVLKAFLDYGKEKVNGKHLSDGEHAIFFLSIHHFKERYFPEKSVSTLNQWVNLFALTGLIEKNSQVPIEMQVEAEKQQALKKKYNHISFYSVPRFETVLKKAELRASLLVEHRISYHQITKAVVLSLFGHAVHDHVYVQRTHGRKQKATPKEQKHDTDRIHAFYHASIAEKGLVVKSDLAQGSSLSKHAFNRIWKELVTSTECEISIPTKDERARYGLTNRQMVARLPEHRRRQTSSFIWKHEHFLPWDEIPPAVNEVSAFA